MTDIERLKSLNIPKECEMYGTIQRAIKALEIVDEFENTRMIIGGRLQGNSMAYKKGLEDGKRKALEEKPCEDCISRKDALSDKGLSEFHYYEDYSKMRNYLKSLPSVQPKIDILDKIRADIEQKCCITVGRENAPAITLYDVFQIIDKYKEG